MVSCNKSKKKENGSTHVMEPVSAPNESLQDIRDAADVVALSVADRGLQTKPMRGRGGENTETIFFPISCQPNTGNLTE
jgi:hypothetical protein